MSVYQEIRHYSPLHDAVMVRLSMFDAHGREYYSLVAPTRPWREHRAELLTRLMEAMDAGSLPGEIA